MSAKIKINKFDLKVWLIFILALIIRLSGLSRRPFDGDEGVVIDLVNRPFGDFWHNFTTDVHPPLHHLLTWISVHLFGVSEFSSRLVPALSGTILVLVIYQIGQDFFNRRVGLTVALLTAFSPQLIYFSQENRMYSLFILLSTLALWQWLKFLQSGSNKTGVGWVIFAVLTAWTQHLGLVLLFIQAIVVIIKFRQKTKLIFQLFCLSVILYLPILAQTIHQFSGRLKEQSGFSFSSNLVGLINGVYRFGAGRTFLALEPSPSYYLNWIKINPLTLIFFLVTFFVPLVLFIYGLIIYQKNYRTKLGLLLPLVALVVLALISSEIGPRSARFLSVLIPIYLLVISLGLDKIKNQFRTIWFCLIIIILGAGVYTHFKRDQQSAGTRDIANYLSANAKDGNVVIARGAFLHGESTILKYYLTKINQSPEFNIIDYFGAYQPGNLDQILSRNTNDIINDNLVNHSSLWYYDFSYTNNPNNDKIISLGKDKEGMEIKLYEFKK